MRQPSITDQPAVAYAIEDIVEQAQENGVHDSDIATELYAQARQLEASR